MMDSQIANCGVREGRARLLVPNHPRECVRLGSSIPTGRLACRTGGEKGAAGGALTWRRTDRVQEPQDFVFTAPWPSLFLALPKFCSAPCLNMGKRRRSCGPGATPSRWSTQHGWAVSEHGPCSPPAAALEVELAQPPADDGCGTVADAGAVPPGSGIDWYGGGCPAGTTPDRDQRASRMLETLLR